MLVVIIYLGYQTMANSFNGVDADWNGFEKRMLRRHRLKDHIKELFGQEDSSRNNYKFLVYLIRHHGTDIQGKRAKTIVNFVKH
jgi:hypothetical protein